MAYQQRDMAGSFVIGGFAAKSVVAQVVSVIGAEDDHSVVAETLLIQCLDDTANFVVDLFNQSCVVGALQHVMLMRWAAFVLNSVPRFPG